MGMGWSVESGMTVFWMFAMAGPTPPYGWGLNPGQPIHAKWVFVFWGEDSAGDGTQTLHMLDNCSTTELCLQQFMYLLFFFFFLLRFGLNM